MNKLFYHTFAKFKPESRLTALFIGILLLSSCAADSTAQIGDTKTQPDPIIVQPAPTTLPTPVATSVPSWLEKPFEKELIEGDHEVIFNSLPISSDAVRSDPSALLVLGKSYYLENNYTFALETLNVLTASFPESEESLYAWYLLGEIYSLLERYDEATHAYTQIVGIDQALDPIIFPKLADAYSYGGQYTTAIQIYEQALLIDPNNVVCRIKIGRAQMFNGDLIQALETFQKVHNETSDDYVKAQTNLLIGQVYVLMEDFPPAFAAWQDNVENYPLSADTFNSLVGLINYDQPVDQFGRGLVDHFADKHGIALTAFEEYLATTPDPDPSVYFYIGLSRREQGEYLLATEAFDKLINNHPDNKYWVAAWDEKAYTYWAYMDDYPSAWKTLETYAINFPQNATASNYLFEAGRIHERGKDLSGAAALWEGLPLQFPDSTQKFDAMFQAGIVRYRIAEYEQACVNFEAATGYAVDKRDQARALFWQGKCQENLGKAAFARQFYQDVIDMQPYDYYGLRARDILAGEPPFASFGSVMSATDLPSLKPQADQWLRILLDLPADHDLTNLGSLQDLDTFKRGMFFWNSAQYRPAREQFRQLMTEVGDDAISNYKLSYAMALIGDHADAREFMTRTVDNIGYSDPAVRANLPEFFNKMIFGIHFEEKLLSSARKYDLDPYFLGAMVWQESAFDPYARSSVGALGLLQIMPFTGIDIAERSGAYANFSTEMLYDPDVNLDLGAYYMNSNLNYLEQDPFAALAGYNAGPGNAKIWKDLANGDLDLELEIIRYGETRQYIKGIYTAFEIFGSIYR